MAGIPLSTVEAAKNSIESTKTKTGLTVVADVIKKTYKNGKNRNCGVGEIMVLSSQIVHSCLPVYYGLFL